MVAAGLLVLLTTSLLTTGAGGLSTQPTAFPAESTGQWAKGSSVNNTSLLTRDELYESVVDGGRDSTTAGLYFVAENGSWYRAEADGTIGASAPHGADIPNIEGETADIPPTERPVYVWKVTKDGCGTTLYNASDGQGIAAYPIPGCRIPAPSAETQTTEDNSVITNTPGFGVSAAIAALCAVAILLLRR